MNALPRNGKIVSVFADESRVLELIYPYQSEVSIAGVNSPENTVISGEAETVDTILKHAPSPEPGLPGTERLTRLPFPTDGTHAGPV